MKKMVVICMTILLAVLAACARQRSFSYAPEEMAGTWTQKYDGSGTVEISESGGRYAVLIRMDKENGEAETWSMTAVPADGNTLRYKDCIHAVWSAGDVSAPAMDILYENGTGTITVLSTFELMWQDDVDNAGENIVFTHT